jgi:hypothetical protein
VTDHGNGATPDPTAPNFTVSLFQSENTSKPSSFSGYVCAPSPAQPSSSGGRGAHRLGKAQLIQPAKGHAKSGADPPGPLFRTIGRITSQLTRTVLPQANAYAMIGRRAAGAGIVTKLGKHSFRATGITAYLKNGGTLEKAAAMANHASTRTTQLYDRRRDDVSLDEVERIVI